MSATTAGLIVIPLVIFLLTVIYGGVRGSIRFAQYLVRSEEAQTSAAESLKSVADKLNEYMSKNDGEIRSLDKRMTVAEYELDIKKRREDGK